MVEFQIIIIKFKPGGRVRDLIDEKIIIVKKLTNDYRFYCYDNNLRRLEFIFYKG